MAGVFLERRKGTGKGPGVTAAVGGAVGRNDQVRQFKTTIGADSGFANFAFLDLAKPSIGRAGREYLNLLAILKTTPAHGKRRVGRDFSRLVQMGLATGRWGDIDAGVVDTSTEQ